MWCVVIKRKDDKNKSFPIMFSEFSSAVEFVESTMMSDDYDNLEVCLTAIREENER